jgi:hypothetical protein
MIWYETGKTNGRLAQWESYTPCQGLLVLVWLPREVSP